MSKKIKVGWQLEAMQDIEFDAVDPKMTDEELVWDRLKNGLRKRTLRDILSEDLGAQLRKEIDKDIIESLIKIANKEDK